MKYLEQLQHLEAQNVQSRLELQSLKWTRPMVFLWRAQGSFLFWAWGLFLFQIAEIAVLAFVHRMSFVPVSTLALRVLSTASLIPVLLSLWITFQSGILYRNRAHSNSTQTKTIVVAWARALFLLLLAASVLLISGFVFLTDLHLSTPPIFRVLVLSGVLSLPLDVVLVFLFLNLKSLKPPELPRLRGWSLVLSGAALVALSQNWVTLFFLLKFVPKAVILGFLWTRLTGTPLSELLRSRVPWTSLILPSLRKRFSLGVLGFVVLELGFLAATHSLLRGHPHWGILLYFVSRILHFGFLFGSRVWLKTPEVKERRFQYWIFAWVISFSLLPFLYLKRDVVFWALPTGEHFVLGWDVLGVVVLLVSFRLLALVTWAKRLLDPRLVVRPLAALAWFPLGLWIFFLGLASHSLAPSWFVSLLIFEVFVGMALIAGFEVRRSIQDLAYGPVSTHDFAMLLTQGMDWTLVRLEAGLVDRSRFVACLQSEKIWGFEIRQNRWLVSGALVDEFLKKRVGRVIVEGSQRSVSSVAELRECFQGPKFPLSKLFYDWPDYEQDQCRSYLETESRSLEFWMESPEFAMEWRRFIRRVRLQTLRFPDASATTLSLKNWVWLMDSNGRFLYLARCEDPTQRAQLRAYCFDRGMEAVH